MDHPWHIGFTDFLFVPLTLALYQALKTINRTAIQQASAFVGLFVALDMAVTWSRYASILVLFNRYSAATDDIQRTSYLAAANYGSAMLTSPLEIVYAIVSLSCGILLIGVVMRRGVFDRTTAYLAVATGLLGVVSLTGWSYAIIGDALFATAFLRRLQTLQVGSVLILIRLSLRDNISGTTTAVRATQGRVFLQTVLSPGCLPKLPRKWDRWYPRSQKLAA